MGPWPELSGLDDNQLIELAQRVWRELVFRGITDSVTEGAGPVLAALLTEDQDKAR